MNTINYDGIVNRFDTITFCQLPDDEEKIGREL